MTCSHFWGLRNLFLHFWVWLGLQGEWNICSIPAVFWWFYCRCFHFCTAPFEGCAMYSQVWGIGWVYRCSHGNGASIPVVFWCRSSPFCISLHLYPTLFKAPLTVRLHIYSHIFWPWSSWRAGTHTQELVRSMAVGFSFGALFARLFKSNWMALSQVVAPSIIHDCFSLRTWLQPAEPFFTDSIPKSGIIRESWQRMCVPTFSAKMVC